MINTPFAATKDPRIGFIGVGGRGTGLLGWFLAQNAQVVASAMLCRRRRSTPASWW
jgi:hypothetical protein